MSWMCAATVVSLHDSYISLRSSSSVSFLDLQLALQSPNSTHWATTNSRTTLFSKIIPHHSPK
ncbi:unnamed protein product [Periconia digitata]|uniref:Uncharacterized protein n=1 Tax=Periconia digitata TaxID=1303443 RepID=A0A9W4UK46_9PLEO|nr:unnamed protein product [Periconia digitata]